MNIHPTAIVDNKASLGSDVTVGPYSVIGPGVTIGDSTNIMGHVVIERDTNIGPGCTIHPFACIGTGPQDLKHGGCATSVRIGRKTTIREYVTINRSTGEGHVTVVGEECFLMAYSHVAHECVIGNGVIIANGTQLAGHVIIDDYAGLSGLCGVHQFVRIGRMSFTGGCSRIAQDVPPFMLVEGNPAEARGTNAVGMKRRGVGDQSRATLKDAFRLLYRENLSTRQAIERMRAELEMCPELEHFISFIEASQRGVIK